MVEISRRVFLGGMAFTVATAAIAPTIFVEAKNDTHIYAVEYKWFGVGKVLVHKGNDIGLMTIAEAKCLPGNEVVTIEINDIVIELRGGGNRIPHFVYSKLTGDFVEFSPYEKSNYRPGQSYAHIFTVNNGRISNSFTAYSGGVVSSQPSS